MVVDIPFKHGIKKMVSYEILITLDNLRLKGGVWYIDKTEFPSNNITEIDLGSKLDWRRLSKEVPEATFSELITQGPIKKLRGITFAKLIDEVIDSENGYVLDLTDERGYPLYDIKSGRFLSESLVER